MVIPIVISYVTSLHGKVTLLRLLRSKGSFVIFAGHTCGFQASQISFMDSDFALFSQYWQDTLYLLFFVLPYLLLGPKMSEKIKYALTSYLSFFGLFIQN
jgi:hypothetical protein